MRISFAPIAIPLFILGAGLTVVVVSQALDISGSHEVSGPAQEESGTLPADIAREAIPAVPTPSPTQTGE